MGLLQGCYAQAAEEMVDRTAMWYWQGSLLPQTESHGVVEKIA